MNNFQWAETTMLQCTRPPPITQNNLNNFTRWMASENPVYEWWNHENPLNINASGFGYDSFPNLTFAASRTAQVLSQGNMSGILNTLRENASLATFSAAVVNSPWEI